MNLTLNNLLHLIDKYPKDILLNVITKEDNYYPITETALMFTKSNLYFYTLPYGGELQEEDWQKKEIKYNVTVVDIYLLSIEGQKILTFDQIKANLLKHKTRLEDLAKLDQIVLWAPPYTEQRSTCLGTFRSKTCFNNQEPLHIINDEIDPTVFVKTDNDLLEEGFPIFGHKVQDNTLYLKSNRLVLS